MTEIRKLSELKLSDLSVVGWYKGGRAYLSSWMGETTSIEVVLLEGVELPLIEGSFMDQKFREALDSFVTLRKHDGEVKNDQVVVIAFGQFED